MRNIVMWQTQRQIDKDRERETRQSEVLIEIAERLRTVKFKLRTQKNYIHITLSYDKMYDKMKKIEEYPRSLILM